MRALLTVVIMSLFVAGMVFAEESTKPAVPAEPEKKAEQETEKKAEGPNKIADLELTENESGLKYFDLVAGTGKEAKNGDAVESHYTLWFPDENGERGQRVQSSKDRGQTFPFTVGQQGLIKGWNEGMVGMKEGGTRLLIVPPELGYGNSPPPGIPKNQTLIFEIELVKIK